MANTIIHEHPVPIPGHPDMVMVNFHIQCAVDLDVASIIINDAVTPVERAALQMFRAYKRRRQARTPRRGQAGIQVGGGWFRLSMPVDLSRLVMDGNNPVKLITTDVLGGRMTDSVNLQLRQFPPGGSPDHRVVARFQSDKPYRRATIGTAPGNSDDGWSLNSLPTKINILDRWPDGSGKILTLEVDSSQSGECVIWATRVQGTPHDALGGQVARVELQDLTPSGPGSRAKVRKSAKPDSPPPNSRGQRPRLP